MEDRLGDLRCFIREMLKEEEYRREGLQKSKKKTRMQRELDKLAFSVNYDRATTENHMGVKLLAS